MANVTQSLFGFTPQDIQAQRDAEMQKQALQFARLSPMESARMGLFQGITQLGNAAGAALGYEDPEMAQARARQGLLGGLDMNDPESLLQAAQSVQATDPQAALALVNQANTLKGTQADINKKKYEMEQEQVTYQNRFSALKAKFPEISDAEARGIAASETSFNEVIKVPKVDTQVVEAGGRQLLINKKDGTTIADIGAAPDRRSLTKVTVNGRGEESEFAKQLGKVQAARLGAAYDKRDAALRELKTFEELATLPDNQLISGSLAEPRVEIANFLNTVGLASEADAQKVASSQQFQKLSNDLVLARVKQLGYNPSDADRKFIEQTIPRLSSSAAARKQLMSFMARVARDVSEEVTAMETYATDKKTLTGYQPKIPQVSMGAPTKSVSSMTDEELLKALQNSKK